MLNIAALAALATLFFITAMRTDDMGLSVLSFLAAVVTASFTADFIGIYLREHYNDWDDPEDDDAAEK